MITAQQPFSHPALLWPLLITEKCASLVIIWSVLPGSWLRTSGIVITRSHYEVKRIIRCCIIQTNHPSVYIVRYEHKWRHPKIMFTNFYPLCRSSSSIIIIFSRWGIHGAWESPIWDKAEVAFCSDLLVHYLYQTPTPSSTISIKLPHFALNSLTDSDFQSFWNILSGEI